MSDNHTKPNVKARHGANLSLNDTNLSLCDRHGQATKHSLNSKARFSVVTPVITHFLVNFIKNIALIKQSLKLACRNSNTNKISLEYIKSLARLTKMTIDTWAEAFFLQVERMNEILVLNKFSKVGE